jgi:hypothetical protein
MEVNKMNKNMKLYVIAKSSHIFDTMPLKLVPVEEIRLDKKIIVVNDNDNYRHVEIEGTLLLKSFNRTIPETKYQDYEFWRVEY